MEVAAKLSRARISAQKARLVADQIRGKRVEEALNILSFSTKKGAHMGRKLLESAIANAEHNDNAKPESLIVKVAVAGQGSTMKRFIPKARGSAGPILKRTCHVKIVVSDLS